MEIFDWINVVQLFLEYFNVTQIVDVEQYIELLRRILFISIAVSGGIYLICLVLGGLGMHTMAKKVGMKHSWLAFLPFANTYYAGKLAGETQLFGKKMKRSGLYAMLAEIAYVAINIFSLIVTFAIYQPGYFQGYYSETGALQRVELVSDRILLEHRWILTADVVCQVLNSISYIVLIFFMCIMFYAFFRKYYARGPFLMVFMSALLPLRGIVIFAVRNNTPVDYNAYLRKRMEQYARRQGGYGPGGYAQGYDPYGNAAPGGYAGGSPADDPFSDFGTPPQQGGDAGGEGSGGAGGTGSDDPFPDF